MLKSENKGLDITLPFFQFTLPEPKKPVEEKSEDYEKEDGEITHDSDEDEDNENDENVLVTKKTPVTIRSKSSLESDCRSPLLIESRHVHIFRLSFEIVLVIKKARGNHERN